MDLYFAWQQWHRERTSVSEETVIRDDQLLADLALILQREERGSSLRNKNIL